MLGAGEGVGRKGQVCLLLDSLNEHLQFLGHTDTWMPLWWGQVERVSRAALKVGLDFQFRLA